MALCCNDGQHVAAYFLASVQKALILARFHGENYDEKQKPVSSYATNDFASSLFVLCRCIACVCISQNTRKQMPSLVLLQYVCLMYNVISAFNDNVVSCQICIQQFFHLIFILLCQCNIAPH